jgi:NAD+ synthase (glutamine-hydrolysing)
LPGPLDIALCQMNPTVGDIAGNEHKILDGLSAALAAGAQVVLFPELAVTGYPPEDLLLKQHFLADARASLERIAAATSGIVALVGFPERDDDVYNACAVLAAGAVQAIYRKVFLPNYGVFDEQRYFQSGTGGALVELGDVALGLTICEDIWEPGPPASDEALAGATLLINISASPYHAGKGAERERMLIQRARDNVAAVAFCNLVGGQDELLFDGYSLVIDHEGNVVATSGAVRRGAARRDDRSRRPARRPAARSEASSSGSPSAAEGAGARHPRASARPIRAAVGERAGG